MKRKLNLIYDGSFEGLLCCVFSSFEENLQVEQISVGKQLQPGFFAETEEIITDNQKVKRVWKALKARTSSNGPAMLYRAFLSETPSVELKILRFCETCFNEPNINELDKDSSNPNTLELQQLAKMVGREKHRMEAFVRFQLTRDQIYFAHIEPDFNVLPLILSHFKGRYADQKWLIYDLKRKFGIFYDLQKCTFITLGLDEKLFSTKSKDSFLDPKEADFQKLWANYFQSVNIKSRINLKLHRQHVPQRYWKYLTEKTVLHE